MKFFPKCIHRRYPRTKRRLLLNTFGGGILNFQRGKLFTCSVACGEGGALQADITWCVGSTRSVRHAGFAPAHRSVLSPSTLLRLPAALYGACPAWRAVSVFGSSTKVRTRLRLRLVPFPAGAAQAARSLTGALSHGAAHLLPSTAPASVSAHVRLLSILLCLFSGAGL